MESEFVIVVMVRVIFFIKFSLFKVILFKLFERSIIKVIFILVFELMFSIDGLVKGLWKIVCICKLLIESFVFVVNVVSVCGICDF